MMQILGKEESTSYFYFLYRQIVKIVQKICEPLKWLKKREEPAVSKLGSLLQFKTTPSVFFSKNNIFYFYSVERICPNLFEKSFVNFFQVIASFLGQILLLQLVGLYVSTMKNRRNFRVKKLFL